MVTPKTYVKKPVEIQAIRFTGSNYSEVGDFMGEALTGDHIVFEPGLERVVELGIRTLEGLMIARPGDWIIRGVQGEFYPCKPNIFEATYTEVTQ